MDTRATGGVCAGRRYAFWIRGDGAVGGGAEVGAARSVHVCGALHGRGSRGGTVMAVPAYCASNSGSFGLNDDTFELNVPGFACDGLTDPSGLTMNEMQKGVNEVVKNTASLGGRACSRPARLLGRSVRGAN